MNVLKRKDFARWQSRENLADIALCMAVQEMERGLIDADLGGFLFKKRIARAGKVFLELSSEALSVAIQAGVLMELDCEQTR